MTPHVMASCSQRQHTQAKTMCRAEFRHHRLARQPEELGNNHHNKPKGLIRPVGSPCATHYLPPLFSHSFGDRDYLTILYEQHDHAPSCALKTSTHIDTLKRTRMIFLRQQHTWAVSESIKDPDAFPSSHAAGVDPLRPPFTCGSEKPHAVTQQCRRCDERTGRRVTKQAQLSTQGPAGSIYRPTARRRAR